MKNITRSLFIGVFPLIAFAIVIYNIILLIKDASLSFQNVGLLFISTSISLFFIGLFLKSQARTTRNLTIFTIFIISGSIILSIGIITDLPSTIILIQACVLLLSWFGYIKWYSVFKNRDTSILKVGYVLPEFNLENLKREQVASSIFTKTPSIWLFYRGNWCPLCVAQVKEVAALYKKINQRGANVILVSPQPHKFSKALARKFNVDFNFLTDVKNTVAKQLGIFSPNGIPAGFQVLGYNSDTVLPTVIVTDSSGKIAYADLTDNYRVRPEPEIFLEVLDTLK